MSRTRRFAIVLAMTVPLTATSCAGPESLRDRGLTRAPGTITATQARSANASPSAEAVAAPSATATLAGYPMAERSEGTPIPTWPSVRGWGPGELAAELRAALPAGATFVADLGSSVAWYIDRATLATEGRLVTYTLEAKLGVALVEVRPPRLRWDLVRDGPPGIVPIEAWPLMITDEAPGMALRTADGAQLMLLDVGAEPHVKDALPLPASWSLADVAGRLRPALLPRDITGDAIEDVLLQIPAGDGRAPLLALFARSADGSARIVEELWAAAALVDLDRDARLEIVEPVEPDAWTVRRWSGEAFEPDGTVTHPPAPAASLAADGGLPALPGAIVFQRRGEGAIWRWPSDGGRLRAIWRAEPDGPQLRGQQVAGDGRHVLLALEPPGEGPHGDVDLALLDVEADAALTLPTHGELRGFKVADDGRRAVYVGIGVDANGAPLPTGTPHPTAGGGVSGTVFAVDMVDPSFARPLGACTAKPVTAWWTIGCLGDVAITPDGARVAWSDGVGLWVSERPEGDPRLVVAHDISDRDGPFSSVYVPDRWVGVGHLIVRVGGWEGTSRAVVDLARGEVAPIAGTPSDYAGSRTELAVQSDGRVLIARASGGNVLASGSIAAPADIEDLWDEPTNHYSPQRHAIGPSIAPDGGLLFGLRHVQASAWPGNGVFRAAPDGTGIARLAALPAIPPMDDVRRIEVPGEIGWSPDGHAFLVQFAGEDGAPVALVGLTDGTGLWDASAVLGDVEWVAWTR